MRSTFSMRRSVNAQGPGARACRIQGAGAAPSTSLRLVPLPRRFAAWEDIRRRRGQRPTSHSSPQIDFDDPWVRAHLIESAFGEDGAFMQAGHLDAELADEMHVVLDHDHRMIARDFAQEI